MKKLILFFMFFLSLTLLHAQKGSQPLPNENEHNLSPDGMFDKVFDHYGNSYKLSDVLVGKEVRADNNQILRSTNPTPMTCGYYDLYFETGSGMEDVSNPIHVERRNVLCRVLTDLSNFINSPLSTNGLNNKVNIWVRNINNVIPPIIANEILGLASSFYMMPNNDISGYGGIVDNEIWKTIHLGRDSFTNAVSPLMSSGIDAGQSGIFYHGMMAFNFSNFSWNTNLTVTSFPDKYDLYTVILHEMTHALGFASLIDEDGTSKFNSGYNYFSRYDTRLKNNVNSQFLIKKQTNACGSMYNYIFNDLLNTNILEPDPNTCNDKVRYVGLSNVPVHTPTAFSPPSSLSHFEGACVATNPSFVMESAIGMNVIRRFLKPQERNVLGDLGFSVNTSYGVSTTYQGTTTYTGTLSGMNVAGMNDGINTNGTYSFIGNPSTNITINSILNNDTNVTSFECLQDVYSLSTFSVTSGNSSTNIIFSSTEPGLHLLRYVPINSSGQRGNITYIYVYIKSNNCNPSICNIINNGGFESSSNCGQLPTFTTPRPVINCWTALAQSPDLFKRGCTTNNFYWSLPVTTSSPNTDTWNNGVNNNNTIIGLWGCQGNCFHEGMQTTLSSSIQPNNEYLLTFKAKVMDVHPNSNLNQTNSAPADIFFGGSQEMLAYTNIYNTLPSALTELTLVTIPNNNQWNSFTVVLNNSDTTLNYLSIINVYNINETNNNTKVYVFIDDISIMPLSNSGFLDFPSTICINQTLTDLNTFLSSAPPNGIFYGTGVSFNANTYSFNALTAGIGNHILSYTYTNNLGCSVTISDNITVLGDNHIDCESCPDNLMFSSTESSTLITYNTSNFIETNTNYLVNSASDITLKAGNFIVIKAESQINSGSQFFARIENCDGSQTGKISNSVTEIIKQPKIFSLPRNIDSYNINENSEFEENFDILGLLISPNPSKGLVNIVTSLNGELQVNVFDIYGKEVINTKVIDNFLNVSNLASGIYIIKITEGGNTATRKLVIK